VSNARLGRDALTRAPHGPDAPPPGAADLQARYYARTADMYDAMHVHENDAHNVALRFVSALVDELHIGSILDVGCGTGRGLQHVRARHPSVLARGLEPSPALIRRAIDVHGISAEHLVCGRGESLPYGDQSFDAVCELGILHHVPDPNAVVREMLRVARRAVFISDGNRFGQGSRLGRITKLALYRLRLWPLANYIKTRGRGYVITPGDGLAYSYSVFDSYDLLAQWASRLIFVPTHAATARSWAHPLLTAGQVLACAIRD
jgi:SAM-dependent methyltransferase